MASSPKESQPVEARLSLWDAISIIIGIVIGAGIYETAPLIFQNVSGPGMAMAVWILGGFLSLIGALCYAELASTYPRLGGDYVYLTRAYGSWAGFLFGWAQLTVILTGSIGMMAYIFANYAVTFWDLDSRWAFMLAGLSVAVLTLLNILGVAFGKNAQNVLTSAKVLGLGGILVAGFFWSQPLRSPAERETIFAQATEAAPGNDERRVGENLPEGAGVADEHADAPDPPTPMEAESLLAEGLEADPAGPELKEWALKDVAQAFSIAMVFVLLTYGGWNDAAFVAAEVRNRRRNLPLALILGVAGITVLYLLVNAAYLLSLGFDGARQSQAIAADVLRQPLGTFGERGMSLLVMISALGAVNGLIFTGSRIYSTMGVDHRIFAWLGRWHPRLKTPFWSLAVQGIVSLALIVAVGARQGQEILSWLVEGIGNRFVWAANRLGLQWEEITPLSWEGHSGFESLLKCTAPIFWLFFLMTGIALFVLRVKDRGIERPFSTPLFPLTPLIFCATCVFMLYSGIIYADKLGLVGGALLLAGLPLYWLSKAAGNFRRPSPARQPH